MVIVERDPQFVRDLMGRATTVRMRVADGSVKEFEGKIVSATLPEIKTGSMAIIHCVVKVLEGQKIDKSGWPSPPRTGKPRQLQGVPMGASGYVHVSVKVIAKETEKAFRIRLQDGTEKWVPKSVVADKENYDEGDTNVTLSLKDWFCEKEGIDGEME